MVKPVCYSSLLNELKIYKHILVTGPQRSGTRIAAKIISSDLNISYVDENELGCRDVCRLIDRLRVKDRNVIQGPAFSYLVHMLHLPETCVVYMMRPIQDIKKSEARIGWTIGDKRSELKGYFKNMEDDPSVVKYAAWTEIQKSTMLMPYFELEYESLKDHTLWMSPSRRINFKWDQTM